MSQMPSCGTPAVKFQTKATSSFDWSTSNEVLAKIAGHSLDFSSWPGSSRAELFLPPRCLIHIKAVTLFGMQLIWRDTEPCHSSPQRIASLFARSSRGALCASGRWTRNG